MNDEQKNYMTDRLNQFTLELSEHLAQSVEGAVKLAVNGKIDGLRNSLENYKKADADWKIEVQPVLETFKNLKWGEKVLIKIGIFLGGLVTFSIGLIELIKLITHLNK